jgi:hypothetical protein
VKIEEILERPNRWEYGSGDARLQNILREPVTWKPVDGAWLGEDKQSPAVYALLGDRMVWVFLDEAEDQSWYVNRAGLANEFAALYEHILAQETAK